MPHGPRGYSLFELVATVAVATIILAIGIPSYGDLMARQRQRIEIDALFHAIHVARKASIMRRQVVTLCPSRDLETCERDRNWSNGWVMFVNQDNDQPPAIDRGEPILRRHRVAETIEIQANRGSFTLRATHRRATNGTLTVCDRSDRIRPKALVVSYTGRPRVAIENSRGLEYECTD